MPTVEDRKFNDGRGRQVSGVIACPDAFAPRQCTGVTIAHGAGNDMHHPLLEAMQRGLAEHGFFSARFNFPYKESGRRLPDPPGVLEDCYRSVVAAVRSDPALRPRHLFLAGKSLGGRIASQLAAAGLASDGLIFLGYPLHPAGQPEKLRSAHLSGITAPMLFFAGTRDPLCRLDLLHMAMREFRAPVTLHIIADGDHSFAVRKRTGRGQADIYAEMVDVAAAWMKRILSAMR